MNKLIEEKIKLDNKIKDLVEDFVVKNRCGYSGEISFVLIKEITHNDNIIVGLNKNINTVITT